MICVFFYSGRQVPAGVTQEEGHTGGRSHRIFHPPSFCGARLYFSREKDSAVPFPRRPRSRFFLCTNDLIVLHLFGIFFIPVTGIRTHVPTCQKVTRLPTELLPGGRPWITNNILMTVQKKMGGYYVVITASKPSYSLINNTSVRGRSSRYY